MMNQRTDISVDPQACRVAEREIIKPHEAYRLALRIVNSQLAHVRAASASAAFKEPEQFELAEVG